MVWYPFFSIPVSLSAKLYIKNCFIFTVLYNLLFYLQCRDNILKEVNCLPMIAMKLSAWFAGALQKSSLLSKRGKRKAKACFAKDH